MVPGLPVERKTAEWITTIQRFFFIRKHNNSSELRQHLIFLLKDCCNGCACRAVTILRACRLDLLCVSLYFLRLLRAEDLLAALRTCKRNQTVDRNDILLQLWRSKPSSSPLPGLFRLHPAMLVRLPSPLHSRNMHGSIPLLLPLYTVLLLHPSLISFLSAR